MKSNIQHKLIGCLLFFLPVALHSQVWQNLRHEIETIIRYETNITDDKIPGFVIGVVIEDSSYFFNFGDQEFITSHHLSENSIFEIGSITNIFTALTLLEVEKKYGISLQDPITNFIIDYQNEDLQKIKLEHLLTHTSGFPIRPNGFGASEMDSRNPFGYYSKDALLDFVKYYATTGPTSYLYSNTNYALLEIILEKVTGESFPASFEKLVKNPLQLSDTGFNYPFHEILPGFDISGTLIKPWTYQSYEGAVGLKSSLADLAKFARYNFEGYNGPLSNTLPELRKMRINTKVTTNTRVGLGWHGVSFKKYFPLIALGGVTGGHSSFIAIVPKTQTAVIILATSPYEMDGLGFLILRMLNNNWKLKKDG
ncbi:MAG: beta-lactamase family protein [Saprospiraceae bacterium]|nr:beta-lactamase family protein [Saprospiraceae bacterium]